MSGKQGWGGCSQHEDLGKATCERCNPLVTAELVRRPSSPCGRRGDVAGGRSPRYLPPDHLSDLCPCASPLKSSVLLPLCQNSAHKSQARHSGRARTRLISSPRRARPAETPSASREGRLPNPGQCSLPRRGFVLQPAPPHLPNGELSLVPALRQNAL